MKKKILAIMFSPEYTTEQERVRAIQVAYTDYLIATVPKLNLVKDGTLGALDLIIKLMEDFDNE